MKTNTYIVDRALHWSAALMLLFMLLNLSSLLHNIDWDIKGQITHRQEAVEIHALVGILLLVVTFVRIVMPFVSKEKIPRIKPTSTAHKVFIQATHIALYSCITLLVLTGIIMINNYEIPIHIFGFVVGDNKEAFYDFFPKVHAIHILLKDSIWWLIAIHFVGIMYAKK
ncbi:cytochrome b/b6 domain-containing protein [Aestuariibacter sp. AA17]|uniref:Cytochrome b/b6 domain-containing protein n=1 Tax=Fluctibacter corallii TaxID=2984329 RepID=A0ABT3A3G8_9ALTE|nr:cytochrome b/b6 domain-containing protein [Aestuariibacter sp. AA17]MCV2883208.1 cytochrome b/b6 domain-containing protein [Aestuariibacter sp. AA17]